MRRVFSALFLCVGVAIALGAYGHGFVGRLNIDRELDKFPIAASVYTMLYVVWYFVSGCMLLCGATVLWAWFQLQRGNRAAMPLVYLISALYLAVGIGGFVYRHGDPFMTVFITLGGLLLLSSLALDRPRAGRTAA
jgi:CHASE2 domain-containing sensor protein